MHSSIEVHKFIYKSIHGFKFSGSFGSEQLQCVGSENESLRGEQVRLLRILTISLLCVRKSFIVHNCGYNTN